MRLVSFDVGIKNMAYCVFDIPEATTLHPTSKISDVSIVAWNTINLMNALEPESNQIKNHTCGCCVTTALKNKKLTKSMF